MHTDNLKLSRNPGIKEWLKRCRSFGLSARAGATILLLNLLATVMETLGVSIFLPIFQFIRVGGDSAVLAAESLMWRQAINTFEGIGLRVNLPLLLIIAFSLFAARQIALYAKTLYFQTTMETMVKGARNRTFMCYLGADTSFQDNMQVGDLVNVMTTETREAVIAVLTPIVFAGTICVALAYFVVLANLSLTMTIVAVTVLGAASYATKIWMRQSLQTGRSLTAANTNTSAFLVGRLRSPRLVRLSGTYLAERQEMDRLTDKQCNEGIQLARMAARVDIAIEPVVIALSCIFLYLAVTIWKLNIEEIGLFLVVALRLLPVVREMAKQWQALQKGQGPVEMVEQRMEQMIRAQEEDSGRKKVARLQQGLQFRDVDFAYQGHENKVLNHVTLEFRANTVTALVGPSGAGKSTLIDLIPRLRRASAGKLLFDGLDINDIELKSLRQQIAYVPQSPQIFSGTIANHIRYGSLGATDDEIVHAARLSGAHDFIERLRDQYNTRIGDGAVELSSGQRQRLDLARALVSQSSILIMDEPTSNLDAESEDAFKASLRKIKDEGRTTVVIVAHRLNNIAAADQIIVLVNGRIDAVGAHTNLINGDNWYANAYQSQITH